MNTTKNSYLEIYIISFHKLPEVGWRVRVVMIGEIPRRPTATIRR